MSSIAASLSKILPAPKHVRSSDEPEKTSSDRGTARILGGGEETGLVLKRVGPPPYGQRSAWRPRTAEDFGDGGAFPEIPVAQYPLDMGRKGTSGSSKALALQVDAKGSVKYDAIARHGHDANRIVHAQFKDLIPLRQRADVGEISLERPSEEEVQEQTERTRQALAKLVSGAVAAQRPKIIKGTNRREPTYVRYTPSDHMGNGGTKNEKIIKIMEKQEDPMEPPKFKHKRIPRGPPSPPAPVMHSPPRRLTAADQEAWTIPPPISNWKNPKGYTVPLDKRLAADGRGLQDVTINDKFAQFAEALFTADRHAREEVRLRSITQQKLAEKEKAQKEENLRQLAQKARDDYNARRGRAKSATSDKDRASRSLSRSRSRSRSSSRDSGEDRRRRRSVSDSEDDEAAREREEARRERRKEAERQLRMKRMGGERRLQQLAKEQNRDIGERVALGLAKPTASGESMYDSRLFSQTSAFATGFNEDQIYDKPLFSAAEAASHIYRPRMNQEDDEAAGEAELDRFRKEKRFDVLGKAAQGFKGAADVEERDGPVQFEAASRGDVYGIDQFLQEVEAGSKKKKHGLEMPAESSSKGKRARVEDDDE